MARAAGINAVQQAQAGTLGQLELPTGQVEQTQAPQPEAPQPQQGGGLMAEMANFQPSQDQQLAQAEADVAQAGVQDLASEVERQMVPSISQRKADPMRHQRWNTSPVANSKEADGGLESRADNMVRAVANEELGLFLTSTETGAHTDWKEGLRGSEFADQIAQTKQDSLVAAMSRVNAISQETRPGRKSPMRVDPMYTKVASAVVENEIFNAAGGQTETYDPLSEALEETQGVEGETGPAQGVTHAQGNGQIGQKINAEYQRMKGVATPEKLPQKEAETLGAAFKEMWWRQNRDLVDRVVDPNTRQYVYQLTSAGETAMAKGETQRSMLFPKTHVKPAKQPLFTKRGQLPGDVGQNVTRATSGSVPTTKGGKQKFGRVLEGAMENLAKVPNVVDKQRAKILFATALPALMSPIGQETWMSEINNFGTSKLQSLEASKADQEKRREEAAKKGEAFDEKDYDVVRNMEAIRNNIAQEVRSVAQERNGANYLSYNIQGFQGRITPQQSFFNPTTSKAVRFVTRNAVPAMAKPGSRVDKNLRQMYAMMLVKGADVKLPDQREFDLQANESKLSRWGNRLQAALDQTMTDDQYEAIAQAMEEGRPLNDPVYQQNLKPFALDPTQDAELIAAIKSKGEDGPHFIDGLIDFAKYTAARKAGKPYNSYFNAYMDGKTNGLASNGIQMGHSDTARRTGVMRNQNQNLLDSEGDIRDVLKALSRDSISQGWDGKVDGFEAELNDVAEKVFSHRDMNKMITMTFGYGKDDFKGKIKETISLIGEMAKTPEYWDNAAKKENFKYGAPNSYNDSLSILDKAFETRDDLAKALWDKYETSLRSVMSDDAIEARSLMRSAAALHAATNQLMTISGPTGMDINLGRSVSTGYDNADKGEYHIVEKGKKDTTTVAFYENEPTAAASRNMGEKVVPGEYAYGGSVVAPVQAMDAATVALTATGRSWDRMKKASGGNPYMHTIYDAFKVDAMGYDVALEEINKNWLNTGFNWNYLEETHKSTKDSMKKFKDSMANRDNNSELSDNEAAYMKWFLEMSESANGKLVMKNWLNKMNNFKTFKDEKAMWDAVSKFQNGMLEVGYPTYNPPEKPKVKHLKKFVELLDSELSLSSRMSAAISKNNKARSELKKEIMEKAYRTPSGERIALQYYAH